MIGEGEAQNAGIECGSAKERRVEEGSMRYLSLFRFLYLAHGEPFLLLPAYPLAAYAEAAVLTLII
jgi:hypothetical protein